MLDTSREWSSIRRHYSSGGYNFSEQMIRLIERLEKAGYIEAGLYGSTSWHDLFLGLSKSVRQNPHLKISPSYNMWPGKPLQCQLMFVDGSQMPWKILINNDEITERVERLLVKRLRWFKELGDEERRTFH